MFFFLLGFEETMGGFCSRCCCRPDNRKYLRTRYNVEREISVEFDNLMDEDLTQIETHQYGSVMTDQERRLLSERKFQDIVKYQRQLDTEIEKELREHEEQLKVEEESFYEAKRAAARVAKRLKNQEFASNQAAAKSTGQQTWTGKDAEDYEIGSEDFHRFLNDVRKKSLNTPVNAVPCQALIHNTETHYVAPLSNGDKATEPASEVLGSDIRSDEAKSETKSTDNPKSNNDADWEADFVSASPLVTEAQENGEL